MKKILIDITHPAQLNFYLNVIKSLCKNYHVIVTILGRGKLPVITRYELDGLHNVEIKVIGSKKNSTLSSVVDANLKRIIQLLFYVSKTKVSLAFTNGFQAAVAGRIFGFPVITFGDDPQAKDYYLKRLFAHKLYFNLYSRRYANLSKRVNILRCLKEWSYLAPDYFTPNEKVLEDYNLTRKNYIFIREVSTNTVNYSNQRNGLVADIKNEIPGNITVLLSLEDKSRRKYYPEDWILLEEPIKDIHSLIYYSRLLVSSGDSMAREAAILGIPGIYIGNRVMYANSVLMDLVDFYHFKPTMSFTDFLKPILEKSSIDQQRKMRAILEDEFIDVVKLISAIPKKLIVD